MKEVKRRLAAIMFTDMVGYSAMMQKDETVAQRLRERHREVFKRQTADHDGEILQYYGDGTLSIFPSAAAAVECALEMQRELKKDPAVPIRIGIHTGDINYSTEDVYGDGVNVASRIESQCVPGGIFISGKVYDDIKNHAQIRALSLGGFNLRNIAGKVEIYAITNHGITVPEHQLFSKKVEKPFVQAALPTSGRKNKFLAGFLAMFLGIFGTHRFYLGQRNLGLIYLAVSLSMLFVIPGMGRFIPIMAIIGLIDAISLWSMPRKDFHGKYSAQLEETARREVMEEKETFSFSEGKEVLQSQLRTYKNKALDRYDDYDYEGAIHWFKRAAEIKNTDPEIHFLLACCYAAKKEAEKAFLHLDTAVAFGFNDFEVIATHEELAHLKSHPMFAAFEKNNYRLPKEDLLQSDRTSPDLLEQLNKLQKLRKDGVLNEDEYERLRVATKKLSGE